MRIAYSEKDKAKVRAAAETRGLVSVMNDTKWRELVTAVQKLPFAPAFQIKDVLEAEPYPVSFEEDVWYGCNWSEGLYPYYSVEWIRVRPRMLKHRGNLLALGLHSIEEEFLAILHEVGVPHRRHGDCIAIVGYSESTANLQR